MKRKYTRTRIEMDESVELWEDPKKLLDELLSRARWTCWDHETCATCPYFHKPCDGSKNITDPRNYKGVIKTLRLYQKREQWIKDVLGSDMTEIEKVRAIRTKVNKLIFLDDKNGN